MAILWLYIFTGEFQYKYIKTCYIRTFPSFSTSCVDPNLPVPNSNLTKISWNTDFLKLSFAVIFQFSVWLSLIKYILSHLLVLALLGKFYN